MTTMTTPMEGQILKVDRLGRIIMPRERREALLEEYERSGMSGQQFAQWAGIKYQTWASWVQKRRRDNASKKGVTGQTIQPGGSQAGKPIRWIEAKIEKETPPPPNATVLILEAPGGIKIEVRNEAQARLAVSILKQLHSPC